MRDQCCPQHLHQRRVGKDRRDRVGEERQGEPLEDPEDGRVCGEQLHADDQECHRDDQPDGLDRAAREELAPGRHGTQVGAHVNGVGDQQTEHGDRHQEGGELAPKAYPQPDAGLEGDSCA